jgi:hypothetical protein
VIVSDDLARNARSVLTGLFAAVAGLLLFTSAASAVILDPPGNRHAKQPPVPIGSLHRTLAFGTSYEAKYRKVYALLSRDRKLISKIRSAAAQYGIDPIHLVGALVGEHTYNVDAYDQLQTYYVKAMSYFSERFTFSYKGEDVTDFVKRPQFASCAGKSGSYQSWTCRERVWEKDFRGRTVGGEKFPNNRFSAVFFQPFYAGQTFGLGQLNPLTALEMSDMVHRVSGLPRLDAGHPRDVYKTIMDPDLTLPYIAAVIRKSIDAYRTIADFDISRNPGITATLYNVGNPVERAEALKRENAARAARGEAPKLPEENYYGWLVNDKLPQLETLFHNG